MDNEVNEEPQSTSTYVIRLWNAVKIYVSSTYQIFFPRIIIILLTWGIFRVLLYIFGKVEGLFLPYFIEFNIDATRFLITIVDLWLVGCILGFLFFIGYRIFEEIDKG